MECLAGAGCKRNFQSIAGNALDQLQQFRNENQGWLFGHLAYDLKNELGQVSSSHYDGIHFPDLNFFEPEIVIRIDEKNFYIESSDPYEVFNQIIHGVDTNPVQPGTIDINNRISRDEYIGIIEKLKGHILRGDCYEINFCQEFFAERVSIDPFTVYQQLSSISPNPFSALYRLNDQWLICASPERFLKKQGRNILSQPIKGTSKRIIANKAEDELSKTALSQSPKERSENVMVVDLVRNDLAKICEEGSVKVDELFGVYSFPQVHQMISTVSGELKEGVSFADIIRATFPMGSMTGAPKKRVMELIEQYEKTRRGLFSGTVGYMSPNDDFDFNVVIRSILYNSANQYLSFQAGSGITFYSDPVQEWEECAIKAEAIKKVLEA